VLWGEGSGECGDGGIGIVTNHNKAQDMQANSTNQITAAVCGLFLMPNWLFICHTIKVY